MFLRIAINTIDPTSGDLHPSENRDSRENQQDITHQSVIEITCSRPPNEYNSHLETVRKNPMNDLINTLLDCPNLSLRLLDRTTGRTVKTLNTEQLRQFARSETSACYQECDQQNCINRPQDERL
jgi:hypothetical protein